MELRPLPASAAGALQEDRDKASRILGAALPSGWPRSDLLDVLPLQAVASANDEHFGVWVMIERDSGGVVGDIGFIGPPDKCGSVELGYSVIPDRRRRGYATEAARAIVAWALHQPGVRLVVAGCDGETRRPSARSNESASGGRVKRMERSDGATATKAAGLTDSRPWFAQCQDRWGRLDSNHY
jgi:GNAT superfamily N-acetyltransferase